MGNVKLHAVLHEKAGAEEFDELFKNGQTHFDEKVSLVFLLQFYQS